MTITGPGPEIVATHRAMLLFQFMDDRYGLNKSQLDALARSMCPFVNNLQGHYENHYRTKEGPRWGETSGVGLSDAEMGRWEYWSKNFHGGWPE